MIIDGKLVKKEKLLELKKQLELLNKKPCLCVVQVGHDEASNVYVRQKAKLCEELGYLTILERKETLNGRKNCSR